MRNNIAEIDWHQVCEVSCLRGTDGWNRLMQAREYLRYQSWCCCILDEFYACSINDVYLFLFEVDSRKEDVDRFVWVVCGNVPSLYLTTDCCPAPKDVFENYCDLAEPRCDGTLPELDFSVKDIPDTEVKDELRQRTAALREAVCRHIFRPFEKEAEVSSNPQRYLAEECIGSYIHLRSGYLAEDLRFAGIHDAVAICKVEATPISDVLDLADQMEVKRLRVINGNLSNLTSNDSIESLIWASTEALPESFDLSSWTHLRRLSLRASHSEVVKIASRRDR